MKKLMTLALAAGMLLGAATGASAIDFKAKGQWLMGFAAGDGSFVSHTNQKGESKKAVDQDDAFSAMQRLRLQLDAVASEALSGTVYFEIGDTTWGQNSSGGALGADSTSVVELKNAYIDWMVPNTDLKFRMGIQAIAMPNVAGGSAVLDDDVAGIVASYQFNENVGLTAVWARPFNDNWDGDSSASNRWTPDGYQNYHDNVDLFALMVPLTFDGVKVTPWAMYGMIGANAWDGIDAGTIGKGNYPQYTMRPYPYANGVWGDNIKDINTGKAYGSAFWACLPISVTAFDPLNIELDINYGYIESMGRYSVMQQNTGDWRRGDTKREGWLVKALVEYKLDWGTPGIFGWYSSGDDGNVKNGSERMPTLSGCGNFMSFMGDANYGWDNGTVEGPYLTTNDGLLEFNLVNSYQIYENLEANLELGYIVNMVDDDTWKRSYRSDSYKKQDAWKAQLIFAYSF